MGVSMPFKLLGLLALGLVVAAPAALPQTADRSVNEAYVFGVPAQPSRTWELSAGGRLYDNWMAALGTISPPTATHPAWPATNTQHTGPTTWRCKSCHGWDYLGAQGAQGKGSYATGIKGVRGVIGKSPETIVKLFSDRRHGITDAMIPPAAKLRLALFLSQGQHDTAAVIRSDGLVVGNLKRGKVLFQTICAACHGYDGKTLDWGDKGSPAFVGTEAVANPWEVLHKIINGNPGHNMASLRALGLNEAADVLAYSQTLPPR